MSRLFIKAAICFMTAFSLLNCSNCKTSEENSKDTGNVVYISTSPKAYAYHVNPNCKWLIRTTHSIKEISLEEAEDRGRRPCSKCS